MLSPITQRFKLNTASYIDWDEPENIHNRGLHDTWFFPAIHLSVVRQGIRLAAERSDASSRYFFSTGGHVVTDT